MKVFNILVLVFTTSFFCVSVQAESDHIETEAATSEGSKILPLVQTEKELVEKENEADEESEELFLEEEDEGC